MPTVCVCCATARGLRVARQVHELLQQIPRQQEQEKGYNLLLISFREGEDEPPFLDDIKSFSHEHENVEFMEARNLGKEEHYERLRSLPDFHLMLVVSWRYMIPPRVFNLPSKGTYIMHDSPLPLYRGFAPTVWAIINGETSFGVTLLVMEEGMDEGDIVAQEMYDIPPHATIKDVMETATTHYLSILRSTLVSLLLQPIDDRTHTSSSTTQEVRRTPQQHALATYTCKRVPQDDNIIDWSQSAKMVYDKIRALTHPYQGAFCYLGCRRMRIWSARFNADEESSSNKKYVSRAPGRIISHTPGGGVSVLCGDGLTVEICTVQLDCVVALGGGGGGGQSGGVCGGSRCCEEQHAGDVINKLGLTLYSSPRP